MTKPQICKVLYLSTAHLTTESVGRLKADYVDGFVWFDKRDCTTDELYGGWMFIDIFRFLTKKCVFSSGETTLFSSCEYDELPDDLQHIVTYACMNDIDCIMFDSAVKETEDLPKYEDKWTGCEELW